MSNSLNRLIEKGAKEAHSHRFIESFHRRLDMGGGGFRHYFDNHWPTFSRYCWVEHLEGREDHPCFQRPRTFGLLHPDIHQHEPRAAEFVKRQFLGLNQDRCEWELLDFARRKDMIREAGFDYNRDIFDILCDYGLNDWRLSWEQYYRIEGDKLVILTGLA